MLRVQATVSGEIEQGLRRVAERTGRSMPDIVTQALEEFLGLDEVYGPVGFYIDNERRRRGLEPLGVSL